MKPIEYKNWIEDPENGLVQEKITMGLKIKAYYRPQKYLALNDLGSDNFSDSTFQQLTNEYSGTGYFELEISMDSSDFIKGHSIDKEDYLNNLYYFTFAFQKDITLIYSGYDTVPTNLYHFERSYSTTNIKKFLLGFEDKNNTGDYVLRIDSSLLPTGVVNLYFDKKNIDKANAIEINI